MKYKVEFAEFHKIEIEADSKEEAEEKNGRYGRRGHIERQH